MKWPFGLIVTFAASAFFAYFGTGFLIGAMRFTGFNRQYLAAAFFLGVAIVLLIGGCSRTWMIVRHRGRDPFAPRDGQDEGDRSP